jgi:opacity protein-like surface antigen
MKNKLLLITVALSLPAVAGDATYDGSTGWGLGPSNGLWSWFVGGSAGYLNDAEEGYFAAHIGLDTPWNLGGWNMAMLAEIGYTGNDTTGSLLNSPLEMETDLVPVTFNVKFERPLTGNLSAYLGGGLGAAFVSTDATSPFLPGELSDDETVFTGSLFGGLLYNVNNAFEIYGGARWMYLNDYSILGTKTDADDDWLFEIGLRFNLGPPIQ